MGYYTWFEMDVQEHKGKYTVNDIIKYLRNSMNEHPDKFYPFRETIEDAEEDDSDASYFGMTCDESSKWYGHDRDMLELSKAFPEIVFCLHGEGSINDDMWNNYYKNGKMQHCKAIITYEEYDESKLE